VWLKWSSIILAYPTGSEGKAVQQSLITIAYSKAPAEIIETLTCLIDKENREHTFISIINSIELIWDNNIANVLLRKAMENETKPENMGCLLGNLLEHAVDEARVFAESLLLLPIPTDELERKRAVIAAKELFHHTSASYWPFLWHLFQLDQQFGKEVILLAADRHRLDSVGILDPITDMQLADLYVWLSIIFPHEEDPKPKGAHWVGPYENVRHFRDGILRQLQHRGTQDACKAIIHIIHEIPELQWLKWVLIDAKAQARRQSWQPLSPQEVITLATNQQLNSIRNGTQIFTNSDMQQQMQDFKIDSATALDNESRELMAVHHAGFIVAKAGQIYRGYTNSDHGIDGEIEFKTEQGEATGKRLYLQLKSGDSYLTTRQGDGAEIFKIKKARWATYWREQAYPVMLVIRTSDGEIRWMDVSTYLNRESAGGKTVKQVVFEGECFDEMSLWRWRDKALGQP